MRKLLGYRLKEEKYRKAAFEIGSLFGDFKEDIHEIDFIKQNSCRYEQLKQAGVMHWFEEVYEEDKKPQAGEYWFHSTGQLELILEYVSERDTVKSLPIHTCKSKGLFSFHGVCTMDRKATTEEIQQALIKEATKRGFKEGVRFKSLEGQGYHTIGEMENWFTNNSLRQVSIKEEWNGKQSNPAIFKDGKWAEILPDNSLNGKTAIIDGVEYELKIK